MGRRLPRSTHNLERPPLIGRSRNLISDNNNKAIAAKNCERAPAGVHPDSSVDSARPLPFLYSGPSFASTFLVRSWQLLLGLGFLVPELSGAAPLYF